MTWTRRTWTSLDFAACDMALAVGRQLIADQRARAAAALAIIAGRRLAGPPAPPPPHPPAAAAAPLSAPACGARQGLEGPEAGRGIGKQARAALGRGAG
jgi:hypothetical protein